MSALDTLRAATSARKAVTMCVDGALQAEWDRALEELDAAGKEDAARGSMEMSATRAAVDRLDELRAKVEASEVTFTFDASRLSWPEYMRLQAEHEPREGNTIDRLRGFNVETFYPALIRRTCATVQGHGDDEPVEIPDEVWDSLLGTGEKSGSLNLNQVNRLTRAADYVMNGETAVPPSARSLLESQDFGASSAQPGPGMSPRSGSEVGSRRGSPSTNTKKKARTKAGSSAR